MNHGPRILVAPLDWGLGHATRCIPVIYELQRQGAEVWIAGEGKQGFLLRSEFPDTPFLELKGYRVRYGKGPISLLGNLLLQAPVILKTIAEEQQWLKSNADKHGFKAIISDNRFGLYHKNIPSIFITHQLNIKSPLGKWNERLLQKVNYRYINRFSECWIPDEPDVENLAGELSHPQRMPAIPARYIGLLSRLKPGNTEVKKHHLFVALSGPEPQRSLFEEKILGDIAHYNFTATVVRGLPGESTLLPSTNQLRFYNHLPVEEFNKEMQMADLIISRSGYSTVMDIVSLQKRSILVPTPGQTEQEYLAEYLKKKNIAFTINQKEFTLATALAKADQFNFQPVQVSGKNQLELAVRSLLENLKSS